MVINIAEDPDPIQKLVLYPRNHNLGTGPLSDGKLRSRA
jgi:hypothetical protein